MPSMAMDDEPAYLPGLLQGGKGRASQERKRKMTYVGHSLRLHNKELAQICLSHTVSVVIS